MSEARHSAELANPAWATWLAALFPLAVYACSAGGHSFWLDSAEFTAAAVDLDITHPPGHPVASLWGRALSLLPIGPLPYRVGVAQAVAAAVAAGALQVAFARTLRVVGLGSPLARSLLSLGAVWCLAFSYGYWFQAVRAEVYALQTMLICLALERLIALAEDEALCDVRPLYLAIFYLGLGLANHHFMSVLAVPALLLELVRALKKRGLRVLWWSALSGAVGLVSYAYLPLRAASEPAMDLGHPVSLRSFWWVISAQVYARRIGTQATQAMDERFADLAVIVVEHFSFVGLPLCVLGLYLMARRRALWPVGYVWGVSALVCLCGRAWLNPVRNNPDVLGYMLPGFAGFVALAACALAILSGSLRSARAQRWAGLSLGTASLVLALAQLGQTYAQAALTDFHATDDFDQTRLATLPSRAVLFLTSPETAFRHWENMAVERARPDVEMVPTAFVNYGGMGEVMLRRRPALAEAVHAFQASSVLTPESLQQLAAARPVLVEPDLTASWPLFDRLLPAGMLYRLLDRAPTHEQLTAAARERDQCLLQLRRRLGDQAQQTETRRQLLWQHYMDALYYASHAETRLALSSLRHARALQPKERELLRLEQTLVERPGTFALRDFLPEH